MTPDRRRLLALFAAFPFAPTQAARAQSGDPAAIVRAIFAEYAADREPKPPYSPAIAGRMRRKEMSADVLLDAQDIDVKNAVITPVSQEGEKAVIDSRFDSFGRKMHLRFDFRVVDGKWMIANVRRLAGGTDPFDMRVWLKLPPLT